MLGTIRKRGQALARRVTRPRSGVWRYIVGSLIAGALGFGGLFALSLAFPDLFKAPVGPLHTASAREPIGTGLGEPFENLFEADAGGLFDHSPAEESTASPAPPPVHLRPLALSSSLRETLKRRQRTSPPEPLPAPLSRDDEPPAATPYNALAGSANEDESAPPAAPAHSAAPIETTSEDASPLGTVIKVAA